MNDKPVLGLVCSKGEPPRRDVRQALSLCCSAVTLACHSAHCMLHHYDHHKSPIHPRATVKDQGRPGTGSIHRRQTQWKGSWAGLPGRVRMYLSLPPKPPVKARSIVIPKIPSHPPLFHSVPLLLPLTSCGIYCLAVGTLYTRLAVCDLLVPAPGHRQLRLLLVHTAATYTC